MLVPIAGGLLFVGGCATMAYCTWAAFHQPRPRDVAFAALAPVAVLAALVGLLLVFVPGFF